MGKMSLKAWQLRIFIICWCAYACIYLGRNNLSIAIPEIQNYLGANKSQIGIIGGLFLWIYGIGQLINGYVGDKVSSRVYIFIGLLVTALANIFFGFATSLAVMSILWVVNGFFQSMLWGPMSKTITQWISPEKRSFAAVAISTSGVGGTLITFILAGQIMQKLNWKWVFWVPGIIILVFSFIWYTVARNHPNDVGLVSPNTEEAACIEDGNSNTQDSYSLWEVIKKTKLWFVVVACIAQGIVKDGINLWAPTFFIETHKLDIKATTSLIIAIPLLGFCGMIFAGWLNKKLHYKEKITTAILFIIGIFMILGLNTLGNKNAFIGVIFLGLSSAMMNGANTLLLGIIPMKFARYNKVSTIAGVLDFSSYFVSGFAAVITGFVVELFGWSGVMVFWIIVTVFGCISLAINQIYENRTLLGIKRSVQTEI